MHSRPRHSRGAAGAGVVAAVLFLAGFALLAVPPSPSDPAPEVVDYLTDKRGSVFAAALLIGLGAGLFLWFLSALAASLPPAEGLAGTLAGFGGAVVVLAALGLLAGLALHVHELEEPGVFLVGFDVYNGLVTIAGVLFAASVVALSAGLRSGALPRVGAAVAALQLATLPGLFAEEGFFAAGGAMAVLAFWALCAWYVAVALSPRSPGWPAARRPRGPAAPPRPPGVPGR